LFKVNPTDIIKVRFQERGVHIVSNPVFVIKDHSDISEYKSMVLDKMISLERRLNSFYDDGAEELSKRLAKIKNFGDKSYKDKWLALIELQEKVVRLGATKAYQTKLITRTPYPITWDISKSSKPLMEQDILRATMATTFQGVIEAATELKRTPWSIKFILDRVYQQESKKINNLFTQEERLEAYTLVLKNQPNQLILIEQEFPNIRKEMKQYTFTGS
jgi:hypothetical protein